MALLRGDASRGRIDLEAWELAIRDAVLALGARLLEGLLADLGCGRRKEPLPGARGEPMRAVGVRSKHISTLLGEVTLRRSVFRDRAGGRTRAPLDEALGVEGTTLSPGVRRFMARAGSRASFADASEDLAIYARVQTTPKQVQRVAEEVGRGVEDWLCRQEPGAAPRRGQPEPPPVPLLYVSFDGTGVPMRKAELEATRGKGSEGKARTREVKLGCVFTQARTDEQGRPVRDEDSTTYVGAIESSELFGMRIYQEAVRRGLDRARQVVVLTDGAGYNKTITATHFPGATHIIDLYHAREHLAELGKILGVDPPLRETWKGLLDLGRVEDILEQAHARFDHAGLGPNDAKACRNNLHYFAKNKDSMRYGKFRLAGLFVGSGVVEAGCRTVIGQRLKHSGMFWSLRGANAIIASRCCQLSNRFDDFWEACA